MQDDREIAEFQRKYLGSFTPGGRIDRRTVLGRLMGGLAGAFALGPGRAKGANLTRPSLAPRRQWDGNLNLVVGGEIMALRRFAASNEPEFMQVIDLCREADVTFAHFEGNFAYLDEVKWAGQGNWGGSYFINDPRIAEDLKWAGIDMVSLAHNHSYDWGVEGLLANIKHCREAGLAYAGTGSDLEEARFPGFLETAHGRIACVSVSSGNRPHEWAGLPKGSIAGRPGMNPLRLEVRYTVPADAAEQLRSIARNLGVGGSDLANPEFNVTPGTQSGGSGFAFAEGEMFEVTSSCHERDLEGQLRAIDFAKTMADFVIVSHHCNQNETGRGDHPMAFAREFARNAIDRGADLYVGHGWHRALAIEMHNGKPMIHGTGNFWAQNEFVERVPADSFEAHDYSHEEMVVGHPGGPNLHPGTGGGDGTWWTAPLYQFSIRGGRVAEIRLHPMEFGWDVSGAEPVRTRTVGSGTQPTGVTHPLTDGRPFMASGANAGAILDRLKRVYAEYGTTVEIEDGIGVVRL